MPGLRPASVAPSGQFWSGPAEPFTVGGWALPRTVADDLIQQRRAARVGRGGVV